MTPAAAPRPALDEVGYGPLHSAAIHTVLPDDLERDTMIAFVARDLQPAPEHAPAWAESVAAELAVRRPRIDAGVIAVAAQGIVLMALCVELKGDPAKLH